MLYETVFGETLNTSMTFRDAIAALHSMNLINIGELAELAISKKANVSLLPACTEGVDTENGVEIKHALTHPERAIRGDTMPAWVSKKNKTGPIAAVVTEQLTGKQYYFFIPESAYSQASANAISVPFNADGTPRKVPRSATYLPNWWSYEESTFSSLCTKVRNFG